MNCPFCRSVLEPHGGGDILLSHPSGACALANDLKHILLWEQLEDAAAQVREESIRPTSTRTMKVSRRYHSHGGYGSRSDYYAPMIRISGATVRSIGLSEGDRFTLMLREDSITIRKATP
jgi:hypothetical protein